MVAGAIKERPARPFERARVTVERFSAQTADIDIDNLYGSAKGLADILCQQSRVHPFGLGIITDDKPSVCDLRVSATKVRHRIDQKTIVTVEALS
jgi:hypothetical protein